MSVDEYKDFQIYMSIVLLDMFVDAIEKQRYASKSWKPLSVYYRTWKQKHNLSLNIWEATGHLKKTLKIFKKGDYIAVGFKQRDLYTHSFIQVNQVAKFLEFGGRKNTDRPPSRPLFRPVTERVRKDVGRYYKKYQSELKRSGKDYLYLTVKTKHKKS
jgi:hypothetical protein